MKVSARALLIGLGIASISAIANAQTAPKDSETIVVTGTRVGQRSALNTAAPVDVVSAQQLTQSGTSELNQALSVALPSLNFPRPGLADGTDSIRPATLRGLAPDQTLVLVNSKRRHSASLVNVNGTVGRGSAAVDMNTIPSGIIRSVEVLRDGASAQYGSDAIAGVVNVRLKEANSSGGFTISYGERITNVETLVAAVPTGANWTVADKANYKRHDGETLNLSAWAGLPVFKNGYFTVAAEYLNQKKTVRTAPDWRQQYALVGTAFDPREATIDRYNAWYGEPNIEQLTLFANFGTKIDANLDYYGWLSYQSRFAESAGFFRRSLDARNVTSIYPDGFLPLIAPQVDDFSFGQGVKWKAGEWDMDLSLVGGYNRMEFTIENTLNRTYGSQSKTQFNAGGFDYKQAVLNLSADRTYEVGLAKPLNFATGIEARREGYSIFAGEPESWNKGIASPTSTPGAQVFPGFQPANEVSPNRTSVSAYVDVEANVTDNFLVSGAVRAENYEDFGSTVTGKLGARWDINDHFALRGSVQNGFRAPSLQQIGYTATATNFIGGVAYEVTTFTPENPVAKALGAKKLEPEKSQNYALGSVIRFGKFNITIDAYKINVDNRIVLSENLGTDDTTTLADDDVRAYLSSQGYPGAAGRFFINGVDTETKGLDIIANYKVTTADFGKFNFTLGANFNDTKVTRIPATNQLSSLAHPPVLFGRVNILTFEKGTPKDKYSFSTDWSLSRYGVTFRATRYGEVLSPGSTGVANTSGADLILEPKIVLDLEGRVQLTPKVKVAIGADNITDQYPTKTPFLLNGTSNTPYSNYSPFGRSGRYVYGKITYEF